MATVISLNFDELSEWAICSYQLQNEQVIRFPKKDVHSTIFFTQVNPFFLREDVKRMINEVLPITIEPPYTFKEMV